MSKLDLGNNEFINYEFHENIGKNTIVFSNSLGSDLSMWDPQAEYFKDDYQIVISDTPGILDPNYQLQEVMMKFINETFIDSDILVFIDEYRN